MIELYTQITDNIFSIYVDLPRSPLRNLNAYLIKGGDRNLLIDTGYRNKICREALAEGLRELDVSMENTDIFLTHMHFDHIGLVEDFLCEGCRAFMSPKDIEKHRFTVSGGVDKWAYNNMMRSGFSKDHLDNSLMFADVGAQGGTSFIDFTPIEDGEILEYGGHRLRAIATPGHTPGHMCLYDEENSIIFLGDHVLFDITPNITSWPDFSDVLGSYIKSLVKIRNIKADIALPAHREAEGTLAERVDQIIEHHGKRVREVVRTVDRHPGMNLYDISGKVSWNIKYDGDWENFPTMQKDFAVGEIKAHVDYLLARGRIVREERDGIYFYYPEGSGPGTDGFAMDLTI